MSEQDAADHINLGRLLLLQNHGGLDLSQIFDLRFDLFFVDCFIERSRILQAQEFYRYILHQADRQDEVLKKGHRHFRRLNDRRCPKLFQHLGCFDLQLLLILCQFRSGWLEYLL